MSAYETLGWTGPLAAVALIVAAFGRIWGKNEIAKFTLAVELAKVWLREKSTPRATAENVGSSPTKCGSAGPRTTTSGSSDAATKPDELHGDTHATSDLIESIKQLVKHLDALTKTLVERETHSGKHEASQK